jgi:hypothetical protein
MRESFVICSYSLLLLWSDKGIWDGWGCSTHGRERERERLEMCCLEDRKGRSLGRHMLWWKVNIKLNLTYINRAWGLGCNQLTLNAVFGIRSSTSAEDFSSSLCLQTASGAHPASCTVGLSTAGAWRWPLTLVPPLTPNAEVRKEEELYLLFPKAPPWRVAGQPYFAEYGLATAMNLQTRDVYSLEYVTSRAMTSAGQQQLC